MGAPTQRVRAAAATRHRIQVQAAVATQREQAAPVRAVDAAGWTTRGRQMVNIRKEGPEREDGKWMRTEGNKRKTVEEEEDSILRKTVKFLKTLERTEAKKESEERLEVVELAEVEVNEEEVEWRTQLERHKHPTR